MSVVSVWLRKGCSCHVSYMLGRGVLVLPCLNYKNQGHRDSFVPKEQIPNHVSPCLVNVFMLWTVLRKSLKFWFLIWRGQKGLAGKWATERAPVLPWCPLVSTRQQEHRPASGGPQGIAASSSCFRKEIKRMSSMSLRIRSCNVTQRSHSYL